MSTGSFQARRAIYQSQHSGESQPESGCIKLPMSADVAATPSRGIRSAQLHHAPSQAAERGVTRMTAR